MADDDDDWRDDRDTRRPRYGHVRPVRELVTDEDCYAAMQYLDEIAHEYGQAYSDVDFHTYILRTVEAIGFEHSTEHAAQAKLMDARNSQRYLRAIDDLRKAQARFREIEAKRAAAQLKIEVWRTIHADKRARDLPDPGRR